jgi:formylglycine-generating enzyme required for sulfatase activity
VMGGCAGSGCQPDDPHAGQAEGPPIRMQVPSFIMGKFEVTLAQYMAFIEATGAQDTLHEHFHTFNSRGPEAPVVLVSWNDAQAFVAWLNSAGRGGWRLPTEAEWEYACRAGSRQLYCGSNTADTVAWHTGNAGRGKAIRWQQPVGSKAANRFGLHDMSGNVAEWVQDCWHDSHAGRPADARARNQGCRDGDGFARRVLRNGGHDLLTELSRASARRHSHAGGGNTTSGFRVARDLPR